MRNKLITAVFILSLCVSAFAQSYNTEAVELGNYIRRMYNSAPFEGVRIVEDYNNCFLISVITLERTKYNNEIVMTRVASVKSMAQASRYFNGSEISADIIIRTSTDKEGHSDTEIIEDIRERSSGYVKEMELLTSFPSKNDCLTFVFSKKMSISGQNDEK